MISFVATAYAKIGFIASIAGGMCMSTVLGSPDCGMTIFNLYDLLQQIESSDDEVSRRVAQAACDSDTSGSETVRPCRRRRGRVGLGGVDALRICR
jgi:hypothetical protein